MPTQITQPLTHNQLPTSNKAGIVLSQKSLRERHGWMTYTDTQVIQIHNLPSHLWPQFLDAITEHLQRRAGNATLERSPINGQDVADWQVQRIVKRFSLVVEAVARRTMDGVQFEVHRFVRRPPKIRSLVGGAGAVLAFTSLGVGVIALATQFAGWNDVWFPAVALGVGVLFFSWFIMDPEAALAAISKSPAPSRPDGHGFKQISPGIESESRTLFEAVKASVLAVERDRLGA